MEYNFSYILITVWQVIQYICLAKKKYKWDFCQNFSILIKYKWSAVCQDI